ncbi:MAG: HDOD domain-containing protein [Pigmentiphaga sp.]|uniref:HDOD domain-containing protein n=1 Tax=Pigmentiphaga sp. TaxID=1977564 RepID=UPI0029BBACD6|nr:HDOD domain-containing protein [Pigmentiphaga sp.]MDX3907930.1 HDOD domain-containing protein [Pigmentiphaga sp.]
MPDPSQRHAVTSKLWSRINERGDFPLLSDSLRVTISAMQGDDRAITSLAQIVLSDFTLTQRVLRLANSAMYMAFGGNITTVSRALVVLGVEAVAHLVLGLKLVDHFQQCHLQLQRLDAKLELNRAMLAGCIARKVCAARDVRAGEEAVVCTLMRQLGRLLCIFYLEHEWAQIRARALAGCCTDDELSAQVLGISFDELGEEAAERWGLPEVIRRGMLPFDFSAPPTGPQAGAECDHWLRAVSSFSVEMSRSMTDAADDAGSRSRRVLETVQCYAAALSLGVEALRGMMGELVKDEASRHFLREIDELQAASAGDAPHSAERTLRDGLRGLRLLPSLHHLGPVLAMASEAMLAGMRFSRAIIFVRDPRRHAFEARLGFGAGIEQLLPQLRFNEIFSGDVFHLAITNPVGIFIENACNPKFGAHIPRWFREVVSDAHAFVLLPVRAGSDTVALVYGDWNSAEQARTMGPGEMAALNELAQELGRFFGQARVAAPAAP